ncbi:MAG: hypothetical protein PF541_15145 [Prolixibacteraceae bacterium]|jgi:hypothetical protein|nr:hypothetical protein [Prolixibacteraceae bacterium]
MITLVLIGITFFSSCEKQELDLNTVEIGNNLDLPFVVSNENGVLNFETKADYELALNYLVELESNGELDQFEKQLGFNSYRSIYQFDEQKMDDIQDNILATFLNPSNKVIIEQKMFEINLIEDRVSVWEHQDCELKSAQDELLIGEFRCDEDVFDLLENGAVLKSVQGDYCKSNKETDNNGGNFIVQESGWVTYYNCKVSYFRAGIYYTLKAVMSVSENRSDIEIDVITCTYTKKNWTKKDKDHSESGYGWSRIYRPFWGLSRLRDHDFKVKFTGKDNATGSTWMTKTLHIECDK